MSLLRRALGALAANLNDPQMAFQPGTVSPYPVPRRRRTTEG